MKKNSLVSNVKLKDAPKRVTGEGTVWASLFQKTMYTNAGWHTLVLRATVAIVMWPHGAQQLLGWFGGYGFSGTMQYFAQLGLPSVISFLVIIIQFFGSLLLLTGLFTRFSAFAMIILVVGMVFSGHTQYGFFMNWGGNQGGEGFEYHLLLLGICLALIFTGGGKLSIDKKLN